MATTEKEHLQEELEQEREELAASVEALRANANLAGALRRRLPLILVATFAASFVLAGGIGATMRLIARRSREK
jgi:cellobiose-specific phosphotransferase system component IIC